MRTEELIRPGYRHDVCSTVQPMAAAAPFFREFDLQSRGVRLVQPEINFAHPLDGGRAAVSRRSLEETADGLGRRRGGLPPAVRPAGRARHRRHRLLPDQPAAPAAHAQRRRRSPTSRSTDCPTCAGWPTGTSTPRGRRRCSAGAAAHGMLDLTQPLTVGARDAARHAVPTTSGWPLIEGGSQKLADAMVTALEEQGGEVVTGHEVTDLREFDGVPGGPARHHARGLRGDGRRPGERGLPAVGVAVPPRRRACSRSTGSCPSRCPGPTPTSAGPGTIHVAGTLEETIAGEAAPDAGPADRQALRARRPADRASTRRGRPTAGTSSGPTCTCRTAPTST